MPALRERIYNRLPVFGQNAAVTVFGLFRHRLRFGPGYAEALSGFREREHLDAEGWRAWQAERLKRLLSAAADEVPYYAATWSEAQKAAARRGDLSALPLLDKAPVRADSRAFLRRSGAAAARHQFHTSGSTGTPIVTWWTPHEVRRSLALREARSAAWAGVSYKRPRATFSGRLAVPPGQAGGPYHRFNAVERQVYFSPYHLGPGTAADYVEALRRHRTEWLTGYAVSYFLLARHILDQGLRPPPLKAVITTSEHVAPEMRQMMQQAYGCRVWEEYSTVENALFASECEAGRLHVSPDAGVVEILRPDGSACDPGEPGEVVTTSFVRDQHLFVRYRLGDVATWAADPCPCGRAMPVLAEVVGRLEDVITGPDGRQLVRLHGVFVNMPRVAEAQVAQKAPDRFLVRVVPAPGFGPEDEAALARRMRERLGAVKVEVAQVDAIPRGARGKIKAVVRELETEDPA